MIVKLCSIKKIHFETPKNIKIEKSMDIQTNIVLLLHLLITTIVLPHHHQILTIKVPMTTMVAMTHVTLKIITTMTTVEIIPTIILVLIIQVEVAYISTNESKRNYQK